MLIEVSLGEILDKFSILEIKKQKIKDEKKLEEINIELNHIYPNISNYLRDFHYKSLKYFNQKIWDLCEETRDFNINPMLYNKKVIDIIKFNDARFRAKDKLNNKFSSIIKEQKSYNKTRCLICPHLGLGDMINALGLVLYMSYMYDEVIVLYKSGFFEDSVRYMMEKENIKVVCYEEKFINNDLFDIYKRNGYDLYRYGLNSETKKINNLRYFYKDLYESFNLDYDIKFIFFNIPRNKTREEELFQLYCKREYQVIHQKNNELNQYLDKDLQVINLNDIPCNNIFEYRKIIKNASKIILTDSSIFCYGINLKLKSKDNILCIRSCNNFYDISEYHKNIKDWKITMV